MDARNCLACESKFENNIDVMDRLLPKLSRERKTICPQCTFVNESDQQICEMCSYSLIKKKRRNVSTSECDGPLEEEDTTTSTLTTGVIDLLAGILQDDLYGSRRSSTKLLDYRICTPSCPHVSQRGVSVGADWSCGYRNIQMLCNSLMALPCYKRVLFQGAGEVPDVHGLQAWIERAWAAGFDSEVFLSSNCLFCVSSKVPGMRTTWWFAIGRNGMDRRNRFV
jgi:hypothetical protein